VSGLSQGFSAAADESPAAGCSRLAAEYDWSDSELGPADQWEPAVEAVVRTMLEATAPMAYLHGAHHAMVYNDRFADLLGARHPRGWAQRAALVMPELWSHPGYAAAVDRVFAGGPPFHDDGGMFDLKGREQPDPDWAFLARGYSAVRDSNDAVLGVLVVVVEIAPVLVLVGGSDQADHGGARWRGAELWDETLARPPLIWSGFRAGAGPPGPAVSETEQRFVTEDQGRRVLPINGPDIEGSIGYLGGVRRHLPDVQMLTLATRVRDDTAERPESGEFYDVFGLPDGRIAVTIGDVIGAGNAAAAVMAQVRVGLRGAALTSSDPNVIFSAVDELVGHLDRTWPAAQGQDPGAAEPDRAGFGGELLVTALVGVFDGATGDLQLASAGHFPPAVVRGRRTNARSIAGYAQVDPGPPLGLGGTRPAIQMALQEGDALVAFTAGLLVRHERDLAQGRAALLQTLSAMSATAARSISQHVVDTMVGKAGLEHDSALLVVVSDSRPHQLAAVLVPPHATAVRGARRWCSAQLESWGLGEGVTAAAVMGISELVSNVVQHAGTSARVTMELAGRLLVTVEDTGTWSTPRTNEQDRSASQGRGLALVSAISDAMGHARGVDGSTVWFEIAVA
jgi:anti-sigma regulatory factor (Ser/Thr protein kinase)